MKKILSVVLTIALVLGMCAAFSACGSDNADKGNSADNKDVKIGVILVGDENEGYSYAHIEGIKKAAKELNIPDENIMWKYSVGENESCHDAAIDLVDKGCTAIFANSYGHQSYIQQAAQEVPEVTFVSMTGDTAKKSGLPNFCNAFTGIYEARYVSGVVAGMKLAELVKNNEPTAKNYDGENIKIGYVGAYPYAEVVSGYTAFYLGVKSVVENVVMDVTYTNSWFDITAEGEAANSLVASGCVIIGQHADSTGAPAAVQALNESGTVCYSIGYNVDMLSVAPKAALTSATNNWVVYYKYAFGQLLKGEKIETNWSEGYKTDAVGITKLGESAAEGTQEKVDEVVKAIKEDKLHVFDTKTFTVDGKEVTTAFATDTDGDFKPDKDEAIIDGYFHESYYQSAPCFTLRIDGIRELN